MIPDLTPHRVLSVAAGISHSVALVEGGGVFTWGRGKNGPLGHGSVRDVRVPTRVGGFLGELHVTSVGAGDAVSMAVVGSTGALYTWGLGFFKQLGLGEERGTGTWLMPTLVPGISAAVAATGGGQHTLVLLDDGHIMSCGSNNWYERGEGRERERDSDSTERSDTCELRGVVVGCSCIQSPYLFGSLPPLIC